MPISAYEQLLVEAMPTRIDTDAQYDATRGRYGELLRKVRRNRAEEKLMGCSVS